jgi:2-polyprenyl-3-methyl-5-hydroxy-6-metoxy-1,4-benzoquinol methylase
MSSTENMTNSASARHSGFSTESSRYHYVVPDFEAHPDIYNRTWILLNWVGTGKRVLELGCSTGYMSQYMAEKRECAVTGVEVDELAAHQARKFCQKVLVRDLNRSDWMTDLIGDSFDVILMADVLEHLADPEKLLSQIRDFLKDADASVVICLPNVVHWLTRLKLLLGQFDYQEGGTLDHTHLRFYTAKTGRRLIESAGYRITKFHPAFGGRLSGHARPIWQRLANWFPGFFAFQLLFEAKRCDAPAESVQMK